MSDLPLNTHRTQVELTQSPSLPRLYALAAATTRGRSGDLPESELLRRGVQVEVDELAAYSRVCGFDLSGRLPSTYLHVLTFPLHVALMADRSFPLALPGMVHVENSNTMSRSVEVGETLTLAVHAEGLRPHPKGALVDLVGRVDATDPRGDVAAAETVWTGRSTYLSHGAQAPDTEGAEGASAASSGRAEMSDRPAATWRIGDDTGRRYAAVSGDINPIHLNPLAAKAFGFPRAIAHGMWTYARTLAWLGARVPAAHTSTVEFSRPVLLPSTVNVHALHGGGSDVDAAWTVELRPGGSRTGTTGRDGAPTRHLRATVRPLLPLPTRPL